MFRSIARHFWGVQKKRLKADRPPSKNQQQKTENRIDPFNPFSELTGLLRVAVPFLFLLSTANNADAMCIAPTHCHLSCLIAAKRRHLTGPDTVLVKRRASVAGSCHNRGPDRG